MSRTITYALQDGELPSGLRISRSGQLRGEIAYSNVFPAPLWDTPTQLLADYEEYDTITPIQLEATSQVEPAGLTYNLVEEYKEDMGLPWGLQLNYNSGIISGTLERLRNSTNATWPPEETPVWVTPAGRIVDMNELTSFEIAFDVNAFDDRPLSYFTVNSGGLPWGLTLSNAGILSGTADRLLSGVAAPIEPKPTWISREGLFAQATSLMPFNRSVEAVPNTGTVIKYDIISGGLPWGFRMSSAGVISGTNTYDPLAKGIDPVPNPPTFTGENTIVLNINRSQNVDFTLPIVPYGSKTLTMVTVLSGKEQLGGLPWGLTLSYSGKLTGTVDSSANIGIYDVQIIAIDSEQARSKFKFKIQVEA